MLTPRPYSLLSVSCLTLHLRPHFLMKSREGLFLQPLPGLAVLPNPVPDRQPCSALCRVSSLGPLPQAEIMAGFPEKVSDWTVMYFYPRHVCAWGTAISLPMMSNLFRESLPVNNKIMKVFFQLVAVVHSITLLDEFVKEDS